MKVADKHPDGREAQGKVYGKGHRAYAFSTLPKSLCVEPHLFGFVPRLHY